jgi:hypothetical protein
MHILNNENLRSAAELPFEIDDERGEPLRLVNTILRRVVLHTLLFCQRNHEMRI